MIRAKLVDTDIRLYELLLALLASVRGKGKGASVFEDFLRKKAKVSEALVFGSGRAALLASLIAMKNIIKSGKTEVIIPAYTPHSLYTVIKQAGLQPVLCDIDLRDFGFDSRRLREKKNSRTLAVIPVRLFGLESSLQGKNDGIFVLEDNAQGFITPLKWDLELLSFNRGKNFPLLNGGAILTNDDGLAFEIRKARDSHSALKFPAKLLALMKFKAFCLSRNMLLYNILLPAIDKMRENNPPGRVKEELLTSWQCMLGAGLLFSSDKKMQLRYEHAKKYFQLLGGLAGLELPEVKDGSMPNRFPLLIKDRARVEGIRLKLRRAGIEASRMYLEPVHSRYGLKSRPGEFKNAEYAAERLLVLPCNPFLSGKAVEYIAAEVKKCFL